MREWLKRIRKQKNLTQMEVAELVHIDRSFYTQIENGTRTPSIEVAQTISRKLNIDPFLFFDTITGPFKRTVEDLPVLLAHTDLDFYFNWVYSSNPELISEDHIGTHIKDLNLKGGLEEWVSLNNEVIQSKNPRRKVITFTSEQGKEVTGIVHVKPLLNDEGTIVGTASFIVFI